jgi:hypothetical protein
LLIELERRSKKAHPPRYWVGFFDWLRTFFDVTALQEMSVKKGFQEMFLMVQTI